MPMSKGRRYIPEIASDGIQEIDVALDWIRIFLTPPLWAERTANGVSASRMPPTSSAGGFHTPAGGACALRSGARATQVDQGGLDPAMNRGLFAQSQLGEDRVDVLLDGPLRQEEGGRDGGVVLALCDLAQHLALPRGE